VVQAPAPSRLIEGGLPTEATIAHVVVAKYADHLPLYRQAQAYARRGVVLDRSTLAHWTGSAAELLKPVHTRLLEQLKASGKLFADETRAPVLDPGAYAPSWASSGPMPATTGRGAVPSAIITDRLKSYGAALAQLGLSHVHHNGKMRENNRAENSHLPSEDVSGRCRGSTPRLQRRVSHQPRCCLQHLLHGPAFDQPTNIEDLPHRRLRCMVRGELRLEFGTGWQRLIFAS
jgi:hypothetical protein